MVGQDAAITVPGDFERQAALVLGVHRLLSEHPRTMVEIFGALVERLPLVGIVEDEQQRRLALTMLCDWFIPPHLPVFISLPVQGMWVRDYGPVLARSAEGAITILDAEYLSPEGPADDAAAARLGMLLKQPVVPVPLTLDGGHLLSNGQGLCLTTSALLGRNAQRDLDRAGIETTLRRYYGFEQVVMLEPLRGEPTGHVDMFAVFTAADVVLVGEYDPAVDAVNAEILNRNAAALEGIRTRSGPLRVMRIPMPSNRGNVWRTYTSGLFVNDLLFVAAYPGIDPEKERAALDLFASLLPGWEVLRLDARALSAKGGSVRSLAVNVPWLDDLFDAPR